MGQVLLKLVEMMRLRSGPQDLPAGRGLALGLAILYIGHGLLGDRMLEDPDAAPRTFLAIAVQFGTIITLLNLRGLATRVPQTISALAGTGFLFGLASLALLTALDPGKPQTGLVMTYFILFIWSLAVDGHIYRHALSVRMSSGVLIAVLIFAANFILLKTLFG
jgi:hypothetical protein